MKGKRFILRLMMLLLMAGGMLNSAWNGAWAASVTYHILTLPIDPSTYDYHMKSAVTGHRLEAFKIVVNDQTEVRLPAHYKSPLATDFTYYKPDDVNGHNGSAVSLYDDVNDSEGVLYKVKGVDTEDPAPTAIAEGTAITTATAEYYVTYSYNASNSIAKLDGSVNYNIAVKNKGFLSLNRGRNNRPAVIAFAKVDPEMLVKEDFSKIEDPGNGVSTYWGPTNDNKNTKDSAEAKFFFGFKFEGKDPYHIILKTSYSRNYTYIEKNEGTNNFVYKWYKGGALFAAGTSNAYIASDDHVRYTQTWENGNPNPTNPSCETKTGFYHGNKSYWGTLALLNNTSSTGYVLMGSRTVDGNGKVPGPNNDKYYYLTFDGYNNLKFGQITAAVATNNHTISGIYPIKKVTFKIATPFYKVEATDAHIISTEDWLSQYTVDNDDIEEQYLPASLKRKYVTFTGKFYKDALCTQEITRFSQATEDPTEGYQVYIGYSVDNAIPFTALSPSASYTTATWYELTDEGSSQEYGRKIKYDGSSAYKNNGAAGVYEKESEFAFVGDPYELKVLYRKGTETAGANRYVTLSTYDTWDIPTDNTSDAYFLLRKYKDANEGKWAWNAGQKSQDIAYSTKAHACSAEKEAQTITFNLTGLNGSKYYQITTGGTDASQIISVDPAAASTHPETGTTATLTVKLAANTSGADKTMTLTIQEYTDDEGSETSGTASVITITQGSTSSFTGNTVTYSTTSSTRLKVMDLPKRYFTYNVVDKSGRIAVKAKAEQTIFSALSLASIPSIIVSPYIVDETVTFYTTYSGGGRGNLSNEITQLTAGNAASSTNVYVKYTTSRINAKPIKLSEDEEFNVKLNDQYVYYDKTNDTILTNASPSSTELTSSVYLWKLRNRDPYAMLIDNLGAREDMSVTGTEDVTVYDDNGGTTTETRQKGAWLKLDAALGNNVGLSFDVDRADAQPFVAKASLQTGVYEVMVADGGTVDAFTTYYNIGRPEANAVKIYNNSTYAHGSDELRFVLNQNVDYQYHLIDKANHLLLTASSKTPDMALPAEYQSPLVATYNFYSRDMMNIDESKTPAEYTPKDPATKLSSISDLNAVYSDPEASNSTEWSGAGEGFKLTATDDNDMRSKAKVQTATGYYYFKINNGASYKKINVTRAYRGLDIYVTYDVNDIVTFNTAQYMLKFLDPLADGYHLEDGNDKLTSTKIQAVYPYCNGDGNLNIYGSEMQEEQFHGGASTRPRWVWYFDSENSDPYHVRIRSRSTINYNSISHSTYLTTQAVHFNQDGDPNTKHVVTSGTLPSIASVAPTEYMVLGTEGHYKLLTTEKINDGASTERRYVTSFEQYWKTYNMLKLCVLGMSKSTDNFEDSWVVPADQRSTLETKLDERGVGTGKWHSYDAYANATRWNGYNDKSSGHGSKVVEKLEHWYQTFDMGNGTFDIESGDLPPVLVLLDRHGWEIMRRPLPTADTYPLGEELDSLRVYDSPMVEKYYFYSNATKASGCHKYTMRMQNGAERDQIKVNGERYSSTSLAKLPPLTATGVVSGGAIQDFYVIYDVKEEYEKSYSYTLDTTVAEYTEMGISQPYLMLQNGRFYKTENTDNKSYITKPIKEHTNPEGGNIYDLIVSPHNHGGTNHHIIDGSGNFIGNNFWYLKPNLRIEEEMGIDWIKATGESTETAAKNKLKKEHWLNNKSGFDPYNLQLQVVNDKDGKPDGRYLTTHIDTVRLVNGILVGDYTGEDYYHHAGSTFVTLETEFTDYEPGTNKGSEDYDHTYLQISNQTFMAVMDKNGNMQLMPRFDHTKRVNTPKNDMGGGKLWSTTLEAPVDHPKASADDNESQGPQTTFFVRPQRFHYHIIDNYGREALRYKRGADYYPAITDHFKSPIANNFTYYKTAPVYDSANDSLILADTITGSYADAGLTAVDCDVYVRYDYDAEADDESDKILQGPWFTAQLAGKDLQASGTVVVPTGSTQGTGVDLYAGDDKPATIDEDDKKWQWKFLQAPTDPASGYYVKPDPYAIEIFNRQANYTDNPSVQPSPMNVAIKVPNANDGANRFAILSHPSGGYALVVAKEYDNNYQYVFLNGGSMTTSVGATTANEAGFNYKTGDISDDAQILLGDTVQHTYTYHVITNADKLAISVEQTNAEADANNFDPVLPDVAQSPLLDLDDYLYYGYAPETSGTYSVVDETKLKTLYGLYDDVVFVRYKEYNMDSTSFRVPNKKTIVDSHVARDPESNDVAMNINGGLPYNIIWYNDNIMQSTDNSTISDGGSHSLSGNEHFVWYFTGGDPYALKIKHKGGSYANGTGTLVAEESAPTFMLLKKTGYDYGILQKTGADNKLTGYGGALTPDASTDPTKYIIFGLSIHKLVYHLIIAKSCADTLHPNTGEYVDIDYRETESGTLTTKHIYGTTQRDLTSVKDGYPADLPGSKYQLGDTVRWNSVLHTYSYDAGSVSLGDTLILPNVFYRTNCLFDFYIEGIYRNYADPSNINQGKPYTDLDNKYKGLKLGKLMSDELLIDQDVVVNVVYSFDAGLETNAGDGFVTSMKPAGSHYLWYTFETAESTPQLAHYTYVRGMRAEKGRELHYTNDYLWSPLGDPYGFRSFNRYIYKNSGESTSVLTTATLADGARVVMGNIADNDNRGIYELLPSANQNSGNFRVHPLLNTDNTLFLDVVESGEHAGEMILSDNLPAKEWTYGLSVDLLNPYYQGAGNVGGLTPDAKKRYEEALADPDIFKMIRRLQRICYNKDSVIPYTPGYYRLYNQPGASSLSPARYASGYLHKIEGDQNEDGNEADAIPMHFYSKAGVNQTFNGDINPLKSGYTTSDATRGDIPIPATEYDLSTIFQFVGEATGATMQTQGRYVQGVETDASSGYAKMTANEASATSFHVADIGGAVVLIYYVDGSANRHYIHYNQADAAHKYDIQYFKNVPVDGSKWCMQPADTMGLKISTHNGGDGYYYATFYAPFDVLLPADGGGKTYNAYTCSKWYETGVHPQEVPATNDYTEGKFVPANTPVIIRVKDESGSVALSIPNATPSTPTTCIFSGQHLEQLLPVDAAHDVYTLGLPMTSDVSKDVDYETTGDITAPLPEFATNGVGFYINATPNKENDPLQALWFRNNRYVIHNKIYYRATGGSPAPGSKGPDFVPILFGDEELPDEQKGNTSLVGESGIYDILGRRYNTLPDAPGIYIVNGQKIIRL